MTDNQKLLTELPFELPGKVYRSPMPFGPYDRLNQVWPLYQDNGIRQVVVLVEKQEYLVQAQRDLPAFYTAEGLRAVHYPIPDFQVPDSQDGLGAAVDDMLSQAQNGENIAVHCLAGVGRTGIFLACMAKRHFDLVGQEAITWVRQFIPDALENPKQEQFVIAF